MTASPTTLEVESGPLPGAKPSRVRKRGRADETLYLIGRPSLRDFVRFVREHALRPPAKATLVDTWNAARDLIRRLEQEENGVDMAPSMSKLGPEYEPLLIQFLKDPLVRNGFNTVPTSVVLVELDRLVVYQRHIDLTYVRQLERRLGTAPTDDQVFRTCLPYDHPQPPVKWSRVHRGKFVFMSPSNDLRFLGSMPMKSRHIKDYPPPGDLVGVVGLAVGFGSNFMNALHAEGRLILNNGSHRAYALRRLGVTHVPCIVQHVASRDEVGLVAAAPVRRNPDLYLKHARPPMLKDYFTRDLHTVFPARRRLRQVTVKFQVAEEDVPAVR